MVANSPQEPKIKTILIENNQYIYVLRKIVMIRREIICILLTPIGGGAHWVMSLFCLFSA